MFAAFSLFFTHCEKDPSSPQPTPPTPPVVMVSVTATAASTTLVYGDSTKIVATAQNAANITITLNGVSVKTAVSGTVEFTTPSLLTTTTYQVTAKNSDGSQVKTVDVTITVAPINPILKLLLDGKWQIVKEETKKVWNGETSYTANAPRSCETDDLYSFPNLKTCIVDWGASHCAPDVESITNKIYFDGYDPKTGILLWLGTDPWNILVINSTTLRIHTLISTYGNFDQKSDYIREYKNVK